MTLILGMSKEEGLYMSADYRVTDLGSGRLVDDAGLKLLVVHYPPVEGGPKALLGYCGLARTPDGTSMQTWMRETLRGESEIFGDSMAHLQQRLNRDFAALGVPLQIAALAIEGDKRYHGGLTNVQRRSDGSHVVVNEFGYVLEELDTSFHFGSGSGAATVVARHLPLLRSQLDIWPRRPLDHMRLLATVNRRVAESDPTVSPFCQVSFINADQRTESASQTFVEHGEHVPFDVPLIFCGIDLSVLGGRLHEQAQAFFRDEVSGEDLDFDPGGADAVRRRP